MHVVHVVQGVAYSLCPWFSTFQQDFLLYLNRETPLEILFLSRALSTAAAVRRSQCDKQKKRVSYQSFWPTLLQYFSVSYHLSVRCIAIGGYLFGFPLFDKIFCLTLFEMDFFAFVTFANNVPVLLNKRREIWRKTGEKKWKRIEKKNSDRHREREKVKGSVNQS